MYYHGFGVKQSHEEAFAWYKQAADHDYAESCHNIALMYEYGVGVAADEDEAVKWHKKQAI